MLSGVVVEMRKHNCPMAQYSKMGSVEHGMMGDTVTRRTRWLVFPADNALVDGVS